nr:acetyltransferase [Agitococcus sp.]
SGEAGRQIVKSETKLALRTHVKTFKKLADM